MDAKAVIESVPSTHRVSHMAYAELPSISEIPAPAV